MRRTRLGITLWSWLAAIAAAVLVIAALWLGFGSGVPVQTTPVQIGQIREFINERAKTRLPRTYLITMPYNGRVEGVDLVEGTSVKEGDVVARIVPIELDLAVKAAKAAVERLDASIRENDDVSVEMTGLEQATRFVTSMDRTVEAAAERVRSGEAKLQFAEKNLGRVQRLRQSGALTEEELDRAELLFVESSVDYQQDKLVLSAMQAMQAATALTPSAIQQYIDRKSLTRAVLEKQKTEAEVLLAEKEYDRARGGMKSPIDGVVLERYQSNEQLLQAGTKLLQLGRLEELEIEVDVLSQDVVRVQVGQPVEIFGPAIGSQPLMGTVRRIFPAGFTKVSSLGVEQQRVKVIVAFSKEDLSRLLDEQRLGVDFRVQVRIVTARRDDVLIVPRSALFRGADSEWQVFAVRSGRAKLQSVQIGLNNDRSAEITAGLQAGQLVILAPETDVTDGVRVQPL